jgi:hypothetical protein
MLDEACTSGRNTKGEALEYGYGWAIDSYSGQKLVRHGGRRVGFRTQNKRIPAMRFTVIMLSNVSDTDASALVDAITAIYLGPDTGGAVKPQ